MSYNPISAALDAGTEALEAAADATAKGPMLPDRLLQMETIEAGLTPAEVVYEENKLELLHYQPEEAGIEVPEDEQNEVPILIVYALINRPYILDLQPDRSVVRRLLEAGHDVYLIDWHEPSRLDQHLTLSDYVNRYIDNCVDVVRERSGQDDINVLGYCMGGTMSAMYAALYPEKVNALGLMAAGLCFDETGGVLEQWGSERHFSPRALTGNQGNVPAEMLDHGFALMDPVDNYVSKYVTWYENLENDDFTANFSRMEKWLSEGIDLAGDAYNEFLEKIYQNNELYENELYLDGEHVDIENIDMPLLQIVGEYDHLIPATTSIPFNDVVGSDDVTLIDYPTGHIGMSVSSSTHEDVWPRVGEWYHEVSERDEGAATEDTSAEAQTGAAADAAAEAETDEATEADTPTPEVAGEAEAARESVEAVSEAARESVEAGEVPDAAPDLEAVNGIGPTFADRLRDAGIERPSDLLDYEAADLAEIAQTSESRAEDWLDTVLEQF